MITSTGDIAITLDGTDLLLKTPNHAGAVPVAIADTGEVIGTIRQSPEGIWLSATTWPRRTVKAILRDLIHQSTTRI